jgi:hypothetical protein
MLALAHRSGKTAIDLSGLPTTAGDTNGEYDKI